MNEFNDKIILITGAASGFGKLLAEKLSLLGAKLILGDLNEAGINAVAESLPGEVFSMKCNVAKETEVKALVENGAAHFGHLDIAINNAGISTVPKSLLEVTEQDMDINFAVNAKSVLFCMKYQVPLMFERGGSILNVASIAGLRAAPGLTPYSASKHAVVGLTKTAAVEFARKNVRINAVCPYFTKTSMIDDLIAKEDTKQHMINPVPMNRLGETEEVVNTIINIISPRNTYLTGQCIAIDGGVTL